LDIGIRLGAEGAAVAEDDFERAFDQDRDSVDDCADVCLIRWTLHTDTDPSSFFAFELPRVPTPHDARDSIPLEAEPPAVGLFQEVALRRARRPRSRPARPKGAAPPRPWRGRAAARRRGARRPRSCRG